MNTESNAVASIGAFKPSNAAQYQQLFAKMGESVVGCVTEKSTYYITLSGQVINLNFLNEKYQIDDERFLALLDEVFYNPKQAQKVLGDGHYIIANEIIWHCKRLEHDEDLIKEWSLDAFLTAKTDQDLLSSAKKMQKALRTLAKEAFYGIV